jgi:hypothetical protein
MNSYLFLEQPTASLKFGCTGLWKGGYLSCGKKLFR